MEKFYLMSGEEICIGDTISTTTKTTHPLWGEEVTVATLTVTEDTIPELIKAGLIYKGFGSGSDYDLDKKLAETNMETSVDINIETLVQSISNKLGWNFSKTCNYLDNLYKIYPAAVLSIMLREVAVILDKKYEDHIKNSPEIYVVSMVNGKISKANKSHIKNYRNFAAFRTLEDARIGCRVTKSILKDLFRSEQKD